MNQKLKSHNQPTPSLQEAQSSLARALVNLAAHPDVSPAVLVWLEQLCSVILGQSKGEASPIADAYLLLAEAIAAVIKLEGRDSHVAGVLEDAAYEVFNRAGHQDELEFLKIQLVEAGKWKARNTRRARKGGVQ